MIDVFFTVPSAVGVVFAESVVMAVVAAMVGATVRVAVVVGAEVVAGAGEMVEAAVKTKSQN
jgi:hypothetical protein